MVVLNTHLWYNANKATEVRHDFRNDRKATAYLDPDDESKDVTIHFDGTPEEFSKELESYILVAMVSNFEHAFLDFSDVTGISRGYFELAVAKFMSKYEQTEGKVNSFCDYEYEE